MMPKRMITKHWGGVSCSPHVYYKHKTSEVQIRTEDKPGRILILVLKYTEI